MSGVHAVSNRRDISGVAPAARRIEGPNRAFRRVCPHAWAQRPKSDVYAHRAAVAPASGGRSDWSPDDRLAGRRFGVLRPLAPPAGFPTTTAHGHKIRSPVNAARRRSARPGPGTERVSLDASRNVSRAAPGFISRCAVVAARSVRHRGEGPWPPSSTRAFSRQRRP
jgi:hypothetical protein